MPSHIATICLSFVTAGAILMSATGTASAAPTPAEKCEAGKNSTAGKYASCMFKAQQKLVAGGSIDTSGYEDAVRTCDEKYGGKWQYLERKADGACPSDGDETGVQDFLDACIVAVEDSLAGAPLPPDVVTCSASLAATNADLGTCRTDLSATNADLAACLATPVCGNGVLETGEHCEAGTLDGQTCVTQGFAGGTLACAPGCTFDTSGCHASRFDASGETILDHQTGLEWEKKDGVGGGANLLDPHDVDNTYQWCAGGALPAPCTNPRNPFDGNAATDFLAVLNGGSTDTCYAGHCDWRLPTVEELAALPSPLPVEFEPYPALDFPYWSSTTSTGWALNAEYVDASGWVDSNRKTAKYAVRAVRGAN